MMQSKMKMHRKITVPILALCILAGAGSAVAQKAPAEKPSNEARPASSVPASAAYAELLLKKTELQSELESLVLEYTEEFPKVKELRHVLTLIDRETGRLAKTKPNDSSKLTLALGKLMIRKVELETELWKLQSSYQEEHPEVKRAKRKVEIYQTAIGEILN